MKKLLLIGKFNSYFQELNGWMEKYFNVQVCVDDFDMVKGMFKINEPDVVVVSLIGLDEKNIRLFNEFKYNHSSTPIICIGSSQELEKYKDFFVLGQFTDLLRPITNYAVVSAICENIGLVYDAENDMILNVYDSKKSILLVDDNPILLRTINGILGNRYDVRMVTSGMNALTQIGKRVPDLIFLDYDMPICDGKMTLQMIREIDEAKDVPVVFLTGVNDKEHIAAVLGLKPAGYLLKPASKEIILETVERILGE